MLVDVRIGEGQCRLLCKESNRNSKDDAVVRRKKGTREGLKWLVFYRSWRKGHGQGDFTQFPSTVFTYKALVSLGRKWKAFAKGAVQWN